MWASGAHDDRNDALVDRTLATLPPHVPDLSGAELAKLAWGLVQQRVGVTDIFESIARASVAALDDMHPRDIAKLSWAMGQVDAGADVLPRALSEHVRRHLEFFSRNVRPTAYASLRWTCLVARALVPDASVDA